MFRGGVCGRVTVRDKRVSLTDSSLTPTLMRCRHKGTCSVADNDRDGSRGESVESPWILKLTSFDRIWASDTSDFDLKKKCTNFYER